MWYKKYSDTYGKPINTEIVKRIRHNFQKQKSREKPVATVVVIAHNEEDTLLGCLWSLSENVSKYPFEVIGVDNNSTDSTSEIFKWCGIRYYKEDKKGPGYARQCGLDHTYSKYSLSADADMIYPKDYITSMLNILTEHGVVCVSSSYGYIPDEVNSGLKLWIYEKLRNTYSVIRSIKRPELSVRGAVMAYYTELGRDIGYRTDIKCGEDGSLALGLKKYGIIRFSFSHNTKALTYTRTIMREGSVLKHLIKATRYCLRYPLSYFYKKEKYENQVENLIENKNPRQK